MSPVALIGRERELALAIDRLADAECRWLTLTGPGGVGKTRLAMAAAARLAPRMRHGMLWYGGRNASGALRDAETLVQQVLEHLGADRHEPGALLLVLDNLETVGGVRALAPLVASRTPGAIVLATSTRNTPPSYLRFRATPSSRVHFLRTRATTTWWRVPTKSSSKRLADRSSSRRQRSSSLTTRMSRTPSARRASRFPRASRASERARECRRARARA